MLLLNLKEIVEKLQNKNICFQTQVEKLTIENKKLTSENKQLIVSNKHISSELNIPREDLKRKDFFLSF